MGIGKTIFIIKILSNATPYFIRPTLSEPRKSPSEPQYVPVDVAFAVYAMWASLLISVGFAIHEAIASSSILDPMLRGGIFLGNFLAIKALPRKQRWARYCTTLLIITFFAFLAMDADGLTGNDLWHMLVKAPIDIFVISRLFKQSTTSWLFKK
jgi:hypothetical protein